MEGVAAAASIISVVQITKEVVKLATHIYNAISGRQCQQFALFKERLEETDRLAKKLQRREHGSTQRGEYADVESWLSQCRIFLDGFRQGSISRYLDTSQGNSEMDKHLQMIDRCYGVILNRLSMDRMEVKIDEIAHIVKHSNLRPFSARSASVPTIAASSSSQPFQSSPTAYIPERSAPARVPSSYPDTIIARYSANQYEEPQSYEGEENAVAQEAESVEPLQRRQTVPELPSMSGGPRRHDSGYQSLSSSGRHGHTLSQNRRASLAGPSGSYDTYGCRTSMSSERSTDSYDAYASGQSRPRIGYLSSSEQSSYSNTSVSTSKSDERRMTYDAIPLSPASGVSPRQSVGSGVGHVEEPAARSLTLWTSKISYLYGNKSKEVASRQYLTLRKAHYSDRKPTMSFDKNQQQPGTTKRYYIREFAPLAMVSDGTQPQITLWFNVTKGKSGRPQKPTQKAKSLYEGLKSLAIETQVDGLVIQFYDEYTLNTFVRTCVDFHKPILKQNASPVWGEGTLQAEDRSLVPASISETAQPTQWDVGTGREYETSASVEAIQARFQEFTFSRFLPPG